jgi:myo-inositol 2-dehydrogenase/D-chiro-inositol 1-dehydrogenase
LIGYGAWGKHVLLEKPMAGTAAECDALLVAARRSGKVLTIGHEFHVSKQWGRIKELLSAGEIGAPKYAMVSLFRHPYRTGAEILKFSGGSYAVITQTLGGFEHHLFVEIVGSEGALRSIWSGAMDRTRAAGGDQGGRRAFCQRKSLLSA